MWEPDQSLTQIFLNELKSARHSFRVQFLHMVSKSHRCLPCPNPTDLCLSVARSNHTSQTNFGGQVYLGTVQIISSQMCPILRDTFHRTLVIQSPRRYGNARREQCLTPIFSLEAGEHQMVPSSGSLQIKSHFWHHIYTWGLFQTKGPPNIHR